MQEKRSWIGIFVLLKKNTFEYKPYKRNWFVCTLMYTKSGFLFAPTGALAVIEFHKWPGCPLFVIFLHFYPYIFRIEHLCLDNSFLYYFNDSFYDSFNDILGTSWGNCGDILIVSMIPSTIPSMKPSMIHSMIPSMILSIIHSMAPSVNLLFILSMHLSIHRSMILSMIGQRFFLWFFQWLC